MEANSIRSGAGAAKAPSGRGILAAGSIAAVATCALVAAAVGLFFVWPYSPDRLSAAGILEFLERDPIGGLVSLDVLMLVIAPINMIVFIALFAALERTDRPLAVTALIAGTVALACLIVCRPIAELVALSGMYASAAGESARATIVAAAEGLLAYFKGTAWIVQTTLFPIAGLIFASLMRRSTAFSRADSTVGIVVSSLALGFFIPKLGLLLLFANTIGTIPWYLMIARRLWRLRATEGGMREAGIQ
jgi:hypothetical protein